MKKTLLFIFMSIMALFSQNQLEATNVSQEREVVNITDNQLEMCLRGYGSIPDVGDITEGDLSKIIDLNCENLGIKDITGLSLLPNLKTLSLWENEITDISPLENLVNLETLSLWGNEISDISSLANLVNLETLYSGRNQITDITPLENLVNLKTLYLDENLITDISPLKNLINLNNLLINDNKISDISSLENLVNINFLFLDSNQITDITSLEQLVDLEILYIENNNVSDISPLENLTKIEYLVLDNNHITDISPLNKINPFFISAVNQNIRLDDVVVDSNDEITYEVRNVNGETQTVSLGSPVLGLNDLQGTWSMNMIYNKTLNNKNLFTGNISQKVTYNEPLSLVGIASASVSEHSNIDTAKFIELFKVKSFKDLEIFVDYSAVNLEVPGIYSVIFSDENGNTVNSKLTVTDVLPSLGVNKTEVTIVSGSGVDEIKAQLGAIATEITEGDLTSRIVYDDSNIDYNTVGEYDLTLTVQDDEGNTALETVKIIVDQQIDTITGKAEANVNEGTVLTDEELTELFEVKSIQNQPVSVDSTNVNFDNPGIYDVHFTNREGLIFDSKLTVNDLKPVLVVDKSEVSIYTDSNLQNIQSQLNVIATEILEGDLTSEVVYDDAMVNYSKLGSYNLMMSVVDNEGNYVDTTVLVNVINPDVDEDDTKSEVTKDPAEKDKVDILVTSGSDKILIVILLVIILILFSILKNRIRR